MMNRGSNGNSKARIGPLPVGTWSRNAGRVSTPQRECPLCDTPLTAAAFRDAQMGWCGGASPPRVDRHALAVLGAHDPPVAVGLAADDHDVDVCLGKMVDQLVVLGLEPGRHRLLAE